MPRKTLKVQVELDIQAVTCPGVWLCPSGKISLQLCMLDSCIQTMGLLPNFPLLYREKYIFYKVFYKARSLSDLQRLLNKEYLYAELIQWQNCEIGNVMASFQTSLGDVLYPSAYEGAVAGVDVDLLMEPSKNFPGILSPKIEISTRTTIEEAVLGEEDKEANAFVVNPKTLPSDQNANAPKRNQIHQQKVCHSVGYHKNRKCIKTRKTASKPPFVFKKADEELLARKPQGTMSNSSSAVNYRCSAPQSCCRTKSPPRMYSKLTENFLKDYGAGRRSKSNGAPKFRKTQNQQPAGCSCDNGQSCPVCSKYSCYFECSSCSLSPRSKGENWTKNPRDSYVTKVIAPSSPTRLQDKIKSHSSSLRQTKNDFQQDSFGKKSCPCSYSSPGTSSPRLHGGYNNSHGSDSYKKQFKVMIRQNKPSLADQLHTRLRQTLDCRNSFPSSGNESPDNTCPKFGNCREGFYNNLRKFYHELHG